MVKCSCCLSGVQQQESESHATRMQNAPAVEAVRTRARYDSHDCRKSSDEPVLDKVGDVMKKTRVEKELFVAIRFPKISLHTLQDMEEFTLDWFVTSIQYLH